VWAVLTHLSERGVFARVEPDRFAMNEPARALLDTGQRRWLDLDGIGGRFAGSWAGLVDLVRTGRPVYERLFGRTFWDDLTEHRHLGESFDALMSAGHGGPDHVPPLAGGWTAVRAVVDVGGGLGHVLANLLAAHRTCEARWSTYPPPPSGRAQPSRPAASPTGSPSSAKASSSGFRPAATSTC
jgi:hypothetical protein